MLEQMLHVFPDADLYSRVDFLPEKKRNFIHNKPVKTTFIQILPWASTKYRKNIIFLSCLWLSSNMTFLHMTW